MFKSQEEYDYFRAWAVEGSCLPQRMFSTDGGEPFKIPAYWEDLKKKAGNQLDLIPLILPESLKDG